MWSWEWCCVVTRVWYSREKPICHWDDLAFVMMRAEWLVCCCNAKSSFIQTRKTQKANTQFYGVRESHRPRWERTKFHFFMGDKKSLWRQFISIFMEGGSPICVIIGNLLCSVLFPRISNKTLVSQQFILPPTSWPAVVQIIIFLLENKLALS